VPKINETEFVQCIMCKRLVPCAEIRFLRVRVSPKQVGRFPVCKLCLVNEKKTRYYIAHRRLRP